MATRRRGVNSMEDDEIQLVQDSSPIEITFSDKSDNLSEKESAPRMGEENHTETVARARTRRRMFDPVKQKLRLGRETWNKSGRQATWWVTVAVLGVTAVLLLAVPLLIKPSPDVDCRDFEKQSFGKEYEAFPYLYKKGDFTMCRRGETVLTGKLGRSHTYLSEVKVDVYSYSNNTFLNVTRLHNNCLRIEWVGMSSRLNPLTDCYDLGKDVSWFAAYEVNNQSWTINNASFPPTSFVPKDYLSPLENQPHVFGSLLHPFWLTSKGVGILVDAGVQLYVSMDRQARLCLHALPFELECAPGAANETFFNYTLCVFDTLSLTVKHFLGDSGRVPHPPHTPNQHVFTDPIWSTSKVTTLSDNSLQRFYDNITSHHGLNMSLLRIEEGYSRNDGDLLFSSGSITSAKLLQLSQSVNISAWVHPFVNYNTANFSEDVENDFYLPSLSEIEGNSVSLVKWWRGYAAVINFLNDSVREKQAQRFETFVTVNNLSSLHFDGGEFTYLPKCVYTENLVHPADYVRAYVKMVGNASYATASSVRVGYFTQDQPIFVRLLDRNFVWDNNNGLQSVLNAIISVGLGGYPFIIPNKIGGNVTSIEDDQNRELYIRWVQLTAFLPVMEFSYLSSLNDPTVISAIRNMTALHSRLVSHKSFQDALSQATAKGYPIIRPLWWVADSQNQLDTQLFTISDQFLVGDNIMAAPIMKPGKNVTKSVYFPKGTQWKLESPLSQRYVCDKDPFSCTNGRIQNFTVLLHETLYFSRID